MAQSRLSNTFSEHVRNALTTWIDRLYAARRRDFATLHGKHRPRGFERTGRAAQIAVCGFRRADKQRACGVAPHLPQRFALHRVAPDGGSAVGIAITDIRN